MNVKDFTYLLQNPNQVTTAEHTKQLEDVLEEFPYFQAARAMHLKGLKTLDSFKYNSALKATAAYTTDRNVLFDFITSKEFLQNSIANSISENAAEEIKTDTAPKETPLIEKSIDAPLPQTIHDANNILDPEIFKSKDPKIDSALKEAKKSEKQAAELGQPLPFTKKEKHSFGQWLQLAEQKTIDRDVTPEKEPKPDFQLEKSVLKQKKFDLIDKFIEKRPKIVPNEKSAFKIDTKQSAKFDDSELMTETLAKVYLEQKKYKKAVQAYNILSLKYPEKSGFFADRIKAIQQIQQENTQ